MVQPYTAKDLAMGEHIVRELHGLRGYDAWAERIAKALSAEREQCIARFHQAEREDAEAAGLI